jgi:hypothetical protein
MQRYVPLKEAAKRHNVEEKVLAQLISAGMIEAKEEAGETLVADAVAELGIRPSRPQNEIDGFGRAAHPTAN